MTAGLPKRYKMVDFFCPLYRPRQNKKMESMP
jgi:hypothetical protein